MQEKIKTEQEQLEEIKMQIRPLDEKSMDLAKKRWMSVAKPLFSLGKLEKAVIQIAGILGTDYYELKKKGLIIMCADNGVVEEGVTQTGQPGPLIRCSFSDKSPLIPYLQIAAV